MAVAIDMKIYGHTGRSCALSGGGGGARPI